MCKRENEGNEQQRELEVVFAQLVAIDRARNSAEVDLAVNTLLQAIGEYTQAERTYIFEMMEEERIFTNIYEWCSEGVTPQIDNLQALTADDMPVGTGDVLDAPVLSSVIADASIPGPYSTSGSAVVYIFLWLIVELTADPGPSRLTP